MGLVQAKTKPLQIRIMRIVVLRESWHLLLGVISKNKNLMGLWKQYVTTVRRSLEGKVGVGQNTCMNIWNMSYEKPKRQWIVCLES